MNVVLPDTADSWESVCCGSGKFVAVAQAGNNAYSEDGINWTETTLPDSRFWSSVCYGNGKFVTVTQDSNIAAYSEDGINWTQTTLPASEKWASVCYGNGKFVAVASQSNVSAYSSDGINWTETTWNVGHDWSSVCYGNGKFVAVASFNTNIAAYSTDGVNWTETTLPFKKDWSSVCYGNGKFVVVVEGRNIAAYSEDGISWTQTILPANEEWISICYGDGKFVTVNYGSNIAAYSEDGIHWTQTTMPANENWYSVCYGNGKFVAVDYNGAAAYSTDGITWLSTATTRELKNADGKDISADVKDAIGAADKTTLDVHLTDKNNPHGVTAEQVGALRVNPWQEAADFNTLLANGIYNCQGINTNTPYGSDGDTHFLVQVYQNNDNWLRQTAFEVRTQRIYTRTKLDGNWQAWEQIMRMDSSGVLQTDGIFTVPHTFNVNGWASFEQIRIKNYGNPFECGQYIDFHAVDSDSDYTTRIYADKAGLLRMAEGVKHDDSSIRPSAILSSVSTPGTEGTIHWQYG